jgi:hypothetical protein
MEPGGVEDKPENLRVGLSGPAGEPVQDEEHEDSAKEGVEEVKDRRAHDEGKEEKLPFDAHECQRTVERSKNGIDSALHAFIPWGKYAVREQSSREKPGHEVDCTYGNADAKDHAGHGSLRPAFPEGEH